MRTSEPPDPTASRVEPPAYRYDRPLDERPSEAVVNAVANATGEPATPNGTADGAVGSAALSPLYERIDPDALDALLAAGTDREADCAVTFTYAGHRVTVSARSVSVTPRD